MFKVQQEFKIDFFWFIVGHSAGELGVCIYFFTVKELMEEVELKEVELELLSVPKGHKICFSYLEFV